ncbi:MAG: HAMP domain-containing histidine kinase [Candidatus Omnitrophica bacterium]|nr:HAMP domain-containing histidine kinase [Candidatus Omnitrophota bacterium]
MKKNNELELLFKELNENPYRRLNFSFLLISVIPVLSLTYVLVDKVASANNNLNSMMYILLFTGLILIFGYVVAYNVIRNIVNKTLVYAAKAKRADELKSSFAISLAHDLKSPLMTVKANISNLKAGFLGKLTQQQEEVINVCKETADRMNTMIMELIDTYMIEAREAKLKITSFDLRELFLEQERELASVALRKNVAMKLELPLKPIMINADKEKMLRAVNNLFNNSIKHSFEGGNVIIKAFVADGFVRVEFLNDGTSIPQDKLEKIFDKFERLDKSVEGQGLGLSIAKDIVELHLGKIWASSKLGAPNFFNVVLPLAKE